MIPASGSAYTYSYVVIGELIAWIVGWSLILEYSLVVSAVAVGWSGYAAPLLQAWAGVPMTLMQGPELGGIVNLPAIAIIAVVAFLPLVILIFLNKDMDKGQKATAGIVGIVWGLVLRTRKPAIYRQIGHGTEPGAYGTELIDAVDAE